MITTSPEYLNHARSRATAPGYMVEIGFNPVHRYSTFGEIEWNGETWYPGAVVTTLAEVVGGGMEAVFRLANDGYQLQPFVMNNKAHGVPVTVWLADLKGPDEPVPVFSGTVYDVPSTGEFVSLKASTVSRIGQKAPDIPAGPPFLNYSTAPGTVIFFGGERIVLE